MTDVSIITRLERFSHHPCGNCYFKDTAALVEKENSLPEEHRLAYFRAMAEQREAACEKIHRWEAVIVQFTDVLQTAWQCCDCGWLVDGECANHLAGGPWY